MKSFGFLFLKVMNGSLISQHPYFIELILRLGAHFFYLPKPKSQWIYAAIYGNISAMLFAHKTIALMR